MRITVRRLPSHSTNHSGCVLSRRCFATFLLFFSFSLIALFFMIVILFYHPALIISFLTSFIPNVILYFSHPSQKQTNKLTHTHTLSHKDTPSFSLTHTPSLSHTRSLLLTTLSLLLSLSLSNIFHLLSAPSSQITSRALSPVKLR